MKMTVGKLFESYLESENALKAKTKEIKGEVRIEEVRELLMKISTTKRILNGCDLEVEIPLQYRSFV